MSVNELSTSGQPMSMADAQACVNDVRSGIANIGRRLLDLYEGQGWIALGHGSWRECVEAEFQFQPGRAYQLLNAEIVNRNISTMVEKPVTERVAREIAKAGGPEQQREVIAEAVATAPKGKDGKRKVKAKDVQRVVAKRVAKTAPKPSADAPVPPPAESPAPPVAPAAPVQPWDDYNAEVDAFAARFESLRDDIVAFATKGGITGPFRTWADPKQYRGVFTDYIATFVGHKVTGFASEAQARVLPGGRNFLYAVDAKKRKASA